MALKRRVFPYAKSDIVILPGDGGVFEIIVQVSDYEKAHGGVRYPFRVGLDSTLPRAVFGRWILLACVAGAFFIMGLYHLALFLYRPTRDKLIYPAFAACCLLPGVRFFIEQDSIAPYFLRGAMNVFIEPVYWTVFSFHCCAIVVFSLMPFEIKLGRKARIALAVMLALPLVLLFLLPAPVCYFVTPFLYYVPFTVELVLIIRSLSLKLVRGRPYLGLYFMSLIFFLVWALFANLILKAQLFVSIVLGNAILMLSQFAMLSQDYTEARKKAHEMTEENLMLDRLTVLKNRFWGDVSHEMKSPLVLISAGIQLAGSLLEKGMDGKKITAVLDSANHEVERALRMIKEALTLTSLQDESARRREIDLGKLYRHTAEVYRPLFELRDNRLNIDVPEDFSSASAPVSGNADKLVQVLVNLLTNANACMENGEITVRMFRSDGAFTVEVCDTGPGIKTEILPRVFERSFREVREEPDEGFGIGLYICRAIVEAHGGAIEIESAPGAGTKVSFSLPAHIETRADGK